MLHLQETTFGQRTHRFKVTGWKKIFHANRNDKKAGVTILLSDKIDFKAKTINKIKKDYIMTIGSIQEEGFYSY